MRINRVITDKEWHKRVLNISRPTAKILQKFLVLKKFPWKLHISQFPFHDDDCDESISKGICLVGCLLLLLLLVAATSAHSRSLRSVWGEMWMTDRRSVGENALKISPNKNKLKENSLLFFRLLLLLRCEWLLTIYEIRKPTSTTIFIIIKSSQWPIRRLILGVCLICGQWHWRMKYLFRWKSLSICDWLWLNAANDHADGNRCKDNYGIEWNIRSDGILPLNYSIRCHIQLKRHWKPTRILRLLLPWTTFWRIQFI